MRIPVKTIYNSGINLLFINEIDDCNLYLFMNESIYGDITKILSSIVTNLLSLIFPGIWNHLIFQDWLIIEINIKNPVKNILLRIFSWLWGTKKRKRINQKYCVQEHSIFDLFFLKGLSKKLSFIVLFCKC